MATKTEMVTFILDNSEKYTQAYLESLSYKKIKTIFSEVNEGHLITSPELVDHPDLIAGDEIGDDELVNVDEFIQDSDILEEIIEKEEVAEIWDYDKLSPNDQRLYRRSGIKRISKSKRYTRFDNETPRI